MDEKNQSPLTIGDILEQLAKPSILQNPEAPSVRSTIPPPLASNTSPAQQLPPIPQKPTGGSISLPRLGQEIKESVLGPTSQAEQSELKLYIRTMNTDIARLRQGQKPSISEVPKATASPLKVIPKPPQPATQTPESQSQRPPIAPSPFAPTPPVIKPQYKQEHFHPEKVISEIVETKKPEEALPPFLGAPVPKKKTPKPEDEKIEYGLIARVVGSGMTTGILATVLIAILAYFAISYFVLNQENIITATPTPTGLTTTVTPIINELDAIFGNIPAVSFAISSDVQEAVPKLISFINSRDLNKKEFQRLNLMDTSGQELIFNSVLTKLSIDLPAGLIIELNNSNHMVFIYGQEELFREKTETDNTSPQRIALIVEVKNPGNVKTIMQNWETSIADDLQYLFEIDPTKQATPDFLTNQRQGATIRYKNFPLPDRSMDYAIVQSLSGRSYLILTNSRESMFSPVDKIRGL